MMNSVNFPIELTCKIYSYLPVNETGRCQIICQEWFQAFNDIDMKELLLNSQLNSKTYSISNLPKFIKEFRLTLNQVNQVIQNSWLFTPMPQYLKSPVLDLTFLLPSPFQKTYLLLTPPIPLDLSCNIGNGKILFTDQTDDDHYRGYKFKKPNCRLCGEYKIFNMPLETKVNSFFLRLIDNLIYLIYKKSDKEFEVFYEEKVSTTVFPSMNYSKRFVALQFDDREAYYFELKEVESENSSYSYCQIM